MTDRVGPVLIPGSLSDALVAAIQEENSGVTVEDRGGYVRVSCPGVCRASCATIRRQLGRDVSLPSDLESVMPSFQGKLEISATEVVWRCRG